MHVEGDLDESERQRVESHLRTCAECWDLAEDLRESQAIFKSIRQDVPNQAMLSAVRARVLEDVAGMESGGWFSRFFLFGFRQRATLAGIALLIVGGSALWLARKPEAPIVPAPPVAVSVEVVPEPVTLTCIQSARCEEAAHSPSETRGHSSGPGTAAASDNPARDGRSERHYLLARR